VTAAGKIRRNAATPTPAPQYSKPASVTGWIDPTRTFAAGVDKPNNAADVNA
jgi:hypothetical protein